MSHTASSLFCSQSRRVKDRLEVLRAAVKYPIEPRKLVGAAVIRPAVAEGGPMSGACHGRVIEHDESTGFRVLYSDGDCEDLSLRELKAVLEPSALAALGYSAREVKATRTTSGAVDAEAPAASVGLSRSGLVLSASEMKEDVCVQLLFERLKQRHESGDAEGGMPAALLMPPPPPAATASSSVAKSGEKAKGKAGRPPKAKSTAPPGSSSSSSAAAAAGGGGGGGGSGKVSPIPEAAVPAAAEEAVVADGGGGGSSSVADGGGVAEVPMPTVEQPADLPPGWQLIMVGNKPRFIGPDGITQVSSLAKAKAWHKRQLQMAEKFAGEQQAKKRRSEAAQWQPMEVDAGAAADTADAPAPADAGSKKKGKRLPRELGNLAIPDREWNVEFANGIVEREFGVAAKPQDAQAAAAAAVDNHEEGEEDDDVEDEQQDEEPKEAAASAGQSVEVEAPAEEGSGEASVELPILR